MSSVTGPPRAGRWATWGSRCSRCAGSTTPSLPCSRPQIYRELGDRPGEATALGNLGVAQLEVRRFDEAVTAFQQASRSSVSSVTGTPRARRWATWGSRCRRCAGSTTPSLPCSRLQRSTASSVTGSAKLRR